MQVENVKLRSVGAKKVWSATLLTQRRKFGNGANLPNLEGDESNLGDEPNLREDGNQETKRQDKPILRENGGEEMRRNEPNLREDGDEETKRTGPERRRRRKLSPNENTY